MIGYNSLVSSDKEYSDELVTEHVGLVSRIAHHLAARLPASVELDDLMQSGMVGLLEAAGNYDPSKGASFDTYAGIRIRGSMLDDIRRHDWTPRSVHQKFRQVTAAIATIENDTGRAAQGQEIAEHLNISIDAYYKILSDSAGSRLFSLEETLAESSFNRASPASATATPDQELSQSQFRQHLAEAIQKLPEREQLVLSLYYERELNLKEIGEVLEVSESRVCQIHGQAMMRLRANVSE